MSKVNCKYCLFYRYGRCEELGEYITPGEYECSWFAPKTTKTVVLLDHAWRVVEEGSPTVFERITQSPETLAVEFVGMMYDRVSGEDRYYSMLTGEFYNSYEEAIAATVARLKEMAE